MRYHKPNVRWFVRRLAACGVASLFLLSLLGCKSNNRYDLIEAELRTRERELTDTRAALDQSRNLLRAYEASQSRGGAGPTPTGSGPFLPVKEIALARGTGGVDEDGAPGDEGLMVVIVPKDEDGAAVKVPARAVVGAWEISPAGLKTPIGSWELPADKLRRTWKSGLISTGYFVAVPWQTVPSAERVRIAVRLVTSDGRTYEADRDVAIKPPLMAAPRVPRVPVVPSPLPPDTEELPPPAPVERGARFLAPEKQ